MLKSTETSSQAEPIIFAISLLQFRLLAQYVEQRLYNGRASVCLSVPLPSLPVTLHCCGFAAVRPVGAHQQCTAARHSAANVSSVTFTTDVVS